MLNPGSEHITTHVQFFTGELICTGFEVNFAALKESTEARNSTTTLVVPCFCGVVRRNHRSLPAYTCICCAGRTLSPPRLTAAYGSARSFCSLPNRCDADIHDLPQHISSGKQTAAANNDGNNNNSNNNNKQQQTTTTTTTTTQKAKTTTTRTRTAPKRIGFALSP
jgi:hypothetical protein